MIMINSDIFINIIYISIGCSVIPTLSINGTLSDVK